MERLNALLLVSFIIIAIYVIVYLYLTINSKKPSQTLNKIGFLGLVLSAVGAYPVIVDHLEEPDFEMSIEYPVTFDENKTPILYITIKGDKEYRHNVTLSDNANHSELNISYRPKRKVPDPEFTSEVTFRLCPSTLLKQYDIRFKGTGDDGKEHYCDYIFEVKHTCDEMPINLLPEIRNITPMNMNEDFLLVDFPITWLVDANDTENDTIYYKFWLTGPLILCNQPVEQKDWNNSNTWTFDTSNFKPGIYCVEVWATDEMHINMFATDLMYLRPNLDYVSLGRYFELRSIYQEIVTPGYLNATPNVCRDNWTIYPIVKPNNSIGTEANFSDTANHDEISIHATTEQNRNSTIIPNVIAEQQAMKIYPVDAYPDENYGATIISGGPENLSSKDNNVMVIKSTPRDNTIIFEFSENFLNREYNEVYMHVDCSISHPDEVFILDLKATDGTNLVSINPEEEICKDLKIDKNRFEHCVEGNFMRIKWSISHQGRQDFAIPQEFNISIDQIYVRLV